MRFLATLWFISVAGQFIPALLSALRIWMTRERNSYNRYLIVLLCGHGIGSLLRLHSAIAGRRVDPTIYVAIAATLEAAGTFLFFLHLMGYIDGFSLMKALKKKQELQ